MAKVKKTENNLVNSYNRHRNRGVLLIVISVICFMFMIPSRGLTWIPFMVCLVFGGINLNKANIFKSGLEGEARSESILADLPDDYYVFPSIEIEYEGKKSQIDHLVIGPSGVFIVEAKNVNGHIVGTDEDRDITIHKVGRKGGKYKSTMYNPTKQVATHVYRTAGCLKENGIHTWVQGMVYFTNPATTVRLGSTKIPVFSDREDGRREIYNYILNYQNKSPLNEVEINKIVNTIEQNLNR